MVAKKAQPARFNFTISDIDKLPAPASGRAVYHDLGCDNLTLVVSPASKSFMWTEENGEMLNIAAIFGGFQQGRLAA